MCQVLLRDKRQGYLLKLTDDMGLKIISDMRQGNLGLSTGDSAIFLVTVTYATGAFLKK